MLQELVRSFSKWPVATAFALLVSAIVYLAAKLETANQTIIETKNELVKTEQRCATEVNNVRSEYAAFLQAALARQQQIEEQLRAVFEKKRK